MAAKNGWKRVEECIYRRGDTFQVRPGVDPASGKKATFGPREGVYDLESARNVRDEKRLEYRRLRRRGSRPEGETIRGFFQRWLRDFPRPAETTNIHHAQQVRPFLETEARELDDQFKRGVTVGDLTFDQFTRKMARRAAVEHRGRLQSVSAMFTDAVQDELLDANPFLRLGLRRGPGRKQLVVVTRDELDLLARCAREVHDDKDGYGERFATMVLSEAWMGIRPGELFVLRWPDFDWDRDEVSIRRNYRSKTRELVDYSKTGDQRRIVLPGPVREPLRRLWERRGRDEWRRDRKNGGEHDVFATKTGQQFSNVAFNYYWSPVRAAFKAKMEERDPGRAHLLFHRADGSAKPMDFYELRHWCATYLLERGVPAHQVAVQLGHKDNGALVMSTYGHPSEDAARDAVRAAFGV